MPLTPGTRLGAYEVVAAIGAGGMGEVYKVLDTRLNRAVAMKVLPSADLERRQRFEREAKAVAALNHPNIVTIHSVEQAGDVTFLTMELVDGKTLSELIPKSGLPVERLLKIAIPLADAVAAAHERGITHRDLKPANVMVTGDGRVKVLDFGLAKLRETVDESGATMTGLSPQGPHGLTGEGRIVGTVAYMSPEQAEGKALDQRTDIFSIGVVLYEMATGERPFKGDTPVSIISSIVKDTPPSLTDVNQSLPRHLARVVKRALVKDPDHRYQTAKDLRNDLETLKEELDSGVMEAPAVSGARPKSVAGGRVMPLAVGGILVAIVAGVLWYFLGGQPAAPSDQPFEHIKFTRLTSTGKVSLAAVSSDSRYVVHVVNDAGKQSLWLRQVATTSNVQIVPPEEARYDAVSFSPDGNFVYYTVYPRNQNFATVYQVPVLGGTPRKIIDDVDTPLAFSPDGKEFAFIRGYQRLGQAVLFIAAADGTGERALVTLKFPLSFLLQNVAWSPDGSTLVAPVGADAQRRTKIVAVDAKTGSQTDVGGQLWAFVESVAWMPDGRGLIAAAQDVVPGASTQMWFVSFPKGDVRRITNDLNSYSQATLSSDGRTLVATQNELRANVWVVPIADPARATQVTSGSGRVDGFQLGLSWTPDGRIVYTSTASGNLDLWIADTTGANQRQLTVDPANDGRPIVTPDGRSVVFASDRGGRGIWRMDLDGGNQRPLIPDAAAAANAVSPDSKWVYYTLVTARPRQVWRLPLAGGAPERLTARWEELGIIEDGAFYHPTIEIFAVSPDGKELAGFYADPDKRGFRIGLFPIVGGKPRRTDIAIPAVSWTPDGRYLLYGDTVGGVGNMFRLGLAGGSPTPVTSFTSDSVMGFALSRDGKQLALSRGTTTSDVVLITREK